MLISVIRFYAILCFHSALSKESAGFTITNEFIAVKLLKILDKRLAV